jgi:hypothetical protein
MTPRAVASLQYLAELARSWGGSLKVITKPAFDAIETYHTTYRRRNKDSGWSFSNTQHHALHWETKRIEILEGMENPGETIHEMGHAFLDLKGPWLSDEWSWLGWEICLAKKAGCYRIWSMNKYDFAVE